MCAILEHPQRHPASVEEFLRMGDAGVFRPEARLELIDTYYDRHPAPADTLLVIEVSDITLAFDLRRKVPLHARAGVPFPK